MSDVRSDDVEMEAAQRSPPLDKPSPLSAEGNAVDGEAPMAKVQNAGSADTKTSPTLSAWNSSSTYVAEAATTLWAEHRKALVVTAVLVGVVGVVLLCVLTPLSFHDVAFDEVGLGYDRLTKIIDDDQIILSGRHHVGPSGTILTYVTTQRVVSLANLTTLTSDALLVSLSVLVTHSLRRTAAALGALQELYGSQEAYDGFIVERVEATTRDVASGFSSSDFFRRRQAFQTALTSRLEELFNDTSTTFSYLKVVQVINVDLPNDVEAVLTEVATSRQDVDNAKAERELSVLLAENRVKVARAEAAITLLIARRDVDVLALRNAQDVLATQVRYDKRNFALNGASGALNLTGDDLVNAYLLPWALTTSHVRAVVSL